MDSKKPLRVNVIGRGPWGQNIVRTLKELGAEVPIVANRETGWEAAFEGNPDRICVAAHPSVNLPVVLECDKRGTPVWIEKPAALNLADVERMAECGGPIFVNYTHLFQKDVLVSCAELLSGILSGRCHDFGMLYDWAPHVLALTIDGPPTNVNHPRPLKEALSAFIDDERGEWPPFTLTLQIHRILDKAEKLRAGR
jgi:hypothetical protein